MLVEVMMNGVTNFPQSYRNAAPVVPNATLQSLEKYWQALRYAQRIPARNDIEPNQIDDALPHAFILQRVAPGIARMRVAGQQLHDLLKMDARGMPISTFFAPQAREEIADLVETAFTAPAIVSVPLISPGGMVRHELTATMLLLPLRDAKGQTSRILGALVSDGMRGNKPRRFEIAPNAPIRQEPLMPKLASVQSISRAAQAKGPDAQRPALRLVVSNP